MVEIVCRILFSIPITNDFIKNAVTVLNTYNSLAAKERKERLRSKGLINAALYYSVTDLSLLNKNATGIACLYLK